MATVSSFEYQKFLEPDSDGVTGVVRFNIRADSAAWAGDGGDDFKETLAEFKDRVPWQLRDWDDRKRLWTVSVPTPFQIEALAVAGEVLLAAGPIDRLNRSAGRLWMLSTKDVNRRAEYALPSPPAADGLAVAGSRVYVSTQDGRLLCFGRAGVTSTPARCRDPVP